MIIFELLKIIGYILLFLLSVILVVLIALLLIPVGYQFKADSSDGFTLSGKIRVLFGLIIAEIRSNSDEKLILRILGIPIKSFKLANEEEKTDKYADLKEEEQLFNMEADLNNTKKNDTTEENSKSDNITTKLSGLVGRIKSAYSKLISIIKNIKAEGQRIVDFINDENLIKAFSKHKSRIFKILRHLTPQKTDLVLKFGTDDPYITGNILASISPFYSFYCNWLRIEPYFDRKILRLDGSIKGRALFCYLIWHFLRIYFDKSVRAIINKNKSV